MKISEKLTNEEKMQLIKEAFLYTRPHERSRAAWLDIDSPIEKLGIQSVTALEMAGYIEEKLDIEFSDTDLANMNRIRDLIDLIDKSMKTTNV